MLLLSFVAQRSTAQSTTSLATDASVLPRGAVGIRVLTSWTRFDELLGDGALNGSPRNIAATLATSSLDPTNVPALAPAQTTIRALSGLASFNLSAGNVVAVANSRIVTAPLILQYGLTSKLTLGVVVPLVETRTSVFAQLNPHKGLASVGSNPALFNQNVAQSNAALVASLRSAASALQQALTQCQANSSGANCATILAQQSTVQTLILATGSFANGVETLYGTGADHPGQPFIPLAADSTNNAQSRIDAQLVNLRNQYSQFLSGVTIPGSLSGAAAPGAGVQFQSLLVGLGYDTVGTIDRTSIGDVSFGGAYQLLNTFGDTSPARDRAPRYRVAVNGDFRFGTGEPANRNRLFDNSTGYGQPGIDVGGAGDLRVGRFAATGLASFTKQLGSIDVARVANPGNALLPLLAAPVSGGTYSAGDVFTLSIIPRYTLARYFAVNGEYQLVHTGADDYSAAPAGVQAGFATATAQQLGFGFTYSTVASPLRGPGAIPFEVRFSHLETLAGSGGPVPKTFRDQIELRVYLTR